MAEVIRQPLYKKLALNLGMKLVGGVGSYYLGQGVGEVINNIPVLRDYIPSLVYSLSGIDVAGNLSGMMGLMGIAIGVGSSGIETEFQRSEIQEYFRKLRGEGEMEVMREKITALKLGPFKLENKVSGWFT